MSLQFKNFFHLLLVTISAGASADVLADSLVPAGMTFGTSWDARWHFSSHEGHCEMSRPIQDYGVARFVASAPHAVSFELQANKDLFAPSGVKVNQTAPAWHSNSPSSPLGQVLHIPGGGFIADGSLARSMFWALKDGDLVTMSGSSRFDRSKGVEIQLSSIGFGELVEDFLSCAATMVRVSWQQLSRTRVMFETNEHALSNDGRRHLDAIAQYLEHETGIKRLYVDGHADASGQERANHALSKRRARSVMDYLVSKGVNKERIVMRYHGERYPVADNADITGRAKNRRTTVRLEKDDSV
ncbi:MAG: OmpA family protein [Pseudomonadota bacterium]